MKTKKLLLIPALTIILLAGCGKQEAPQIDPEVKAAMEKMEAYSNGETPTDPEEKEKEPKEEPEENQDNSDASEAERLASYKMLIEASIMNNFKDSYSITSDQESKLITVNIWYDGLVQELTLAQLGKQENIDTWNNTKEIIRGLSEKFYDGRNSFDLPDYHVTINVLNNLNKENVLLMTLDNVVLYDVLEEKK